MEQIITNMNLLNRSIEGIVAVRKVLLRLLRQRLGWKGVRKRIHALEIFSRGLSKGRRNRDGCQHRTGAVKYDEE
jgi:hypothetical protein